MECDLSWVAVSARLLRPRRNPLLTVKVALEAQKLTALLDSRSSVSMIRSHLLLASLPVLGWAWVSCLHRHIQWLPIVKAQVRYAGALHNLNLIRADDLPWPLLLGRDTPHFTLLLQQASQGETLATTIDDPREGPSGGQCDETPPLATLRPNPTWLTDPAFLQAQEEDPSLLQVRQSVTAVDGQV